MKKLLFLLIPFFCVYLSFSQNEQWEYYYYHSGIWSFAEDENHIWVGTYGGGLISIDKETGEKVRYNMFSILGMGTNNTVHAIAIDHDGNKWLSTENMLIKFDGNSCIAYTCEDFGLPQLLYEYIITIAVDKNNDIWFGIDDYVIKFDGENFTNHKIHDEVKEIVIDNNNVKWVTCSYKILSFNDTVWTEHLTDRGTHFHYALTCDKDNNIWTAYHKNYCTNAEIAKFDGEEWVTFSPGNSSLPTGINIEYMDIEDDGTVWLASSRGLIEFADDTCIVYDTISPAMDYCYANRIFVDSNNKKWVNYNMHSYTGGIECLLIEMDGEEWIVHNLKNSGLLSRSITTMSIDQENNKWIANNGYLIKYDGNNWETYDLMDLTGINSSYVLSIDIDDEDRFFLLTNNDIVIYDGNTWGVMNSENTSLSINFYRSIIHSYGNGNIWLGTEGSGLIHIDANRNIIRYNSSNSGLPSNSVRSITTDKAGKTWVGTSGGLAVFDGNDWVVYTYNNSGLPSNYVSALAIDLDSNIWIGTYNGVAKFNGTDWEVYTNEYLELSSNARVTSIAVDSKNNVYVGTSYNGMLKFSDNEWEVFSSSNSPIYGNGINSIVIDKYDNKWICKEDYGITVYNENGIDDTSDIFEIISTSGSLIEIYPNPSNSVIEVRSSENITISAIEIRDIYGHIIENKNINSSGYKTDISHLSPGIYFIKTRFGNKVEVSRIIKQ
ncbi:MAG: T9SS type A sorting domain-containing protein [Bacteroidales bacterium]|jgi:ligand-binding sensor domain-containing protein|nr:T9SS type A sorting domain-containing protein [Bacteroidales bacterium]